MRIVGSLRVPPATQLITRCFYVKLLVGVLLASSLPVGGLCAYLVHLGHERAAEVAAAAAAAEAALNATRASPLVVTVQSSNTKELWVNEVAHRFNERILRSSTGRQIVVVVHHTGSPLKPQLKPMIWSPASTQWVRLQEAGRAQKPGAAPGCPTQPAIAAQPLVTDTERQCMPTLAMPIGVAMWRSRAVALGWPDLPISYRQLFRLAADPDGWASIAAMPQFAGSNLTRAQLAAWGSLKLGHGHPKSSNSGRLSVATALYAAAGLSAADALSTGHVSDPSVLERLAELEGAVYHLGKVDTDLLTKMVRHGPAYLDAVANYEGNVIRWNRDYAAQLSRDFHDSLVFLYPSDGIFVMDHPLCVLDDPAHLASIRPELSPTEHAVRSRENSNPG